LQPPIGSSRPPAMSSLIQTRLIFNSRPAL
jgi:hypothetical protein